MSDNEWLEVDEFFWDNIDEDIGDENRRTRLKALLLLGVFVIPTLLFTIEIMTGWFTSQWKESIEPSIREIIPLVHF